MTRATPICLAVLIGLCAALVAKGAVSDAELDRLKLLENALENSRAQSSWTSTLRTTSTVKNRTGSTFSDILLISQEGERRQSARADPPGAFDSYLLVNQSVNGTQGPERTQVSFGWVLEVSTLGIETDDDAWVRYSSVRPSVLEAGLPLEWTRASSGVGTDNGLNTSFAALTEPYFKLDSSIFTEDSVQDVLELDITELNGRSTRLFWINWLTETETEGALETTVLLGRRDVPQVVPGNVVDSSSSVSWYWVDVETELVFRIEHRSTSPTGSGGLVEVVRFFAFADYNQPVEIPGP